MKKIFKLTTLVLMGLLSFTALVSCGKSKSAISVVATIFPEYDWAKQIIKENDVELTQLIDKGSDLHSFEPSASDIAKVSECDLFIYVGGESDNWVPDCLKEAKNKEHMQVINLLEVLGDKVKEEEVVEGMEGDDDCDDCEDDSEEIEYDEHVWMSIKNASIICQKIADCLGIIDEENKESYEKNNLEYQEELTLLDEKYETMFSSASIHTLVVPDRFPFRYITIDYNLSYYAAFVGCSAETNASASTIAFLVKKVNELNLNYVFALDTNTDKKIAHTVINESNNKNIEILNLCSMEGLKSSDSKNGVTYISVMEQNYKSFEKGLN